MCVLLITRLLRLVGRLGSREPVKPYQFGGYRQSKKNRTKSIRNSCVIKVFCGVVTLLFDFFVGEGAFVIGLTDISSFFS